MDVTCERCETVYEFDETLLSGRGTTVKCTQCGHIFKVLPPGASTGSEPAGWKVRRKDGSVLAVQSLKELQHRIADGQLAQDDEISRDGSAWKPLGQIAELRSFFEVSRPAAPRQPAAPPARERQRTQLGVGSLTSERPPAGGEGATAPTQPEGAAPPPTQAEDQPAARAPSGPEHPARADDQAPASGPPPQSPGRRAHKPTLVGLGQQPGSTEGGTPSGAEAAPDTEATASAAATVNANWGAAGTPPGPPAATGGHTGPASGEPPGREPPRSEPPASEPPEGPGTEGPGLSEPGTEQGSPHDDGAFADTLRAIDPPPAPAEPPAVDGAARRSAPTVGGAPRQPAPASPARAHERAPAPPTPARRRLYLEEEEREALPGTSSRAPWILGAIAIAALVGVGVWLAWPMIAERTGLGEEADPLAPFLERAETAMAADHVDAYEEAVREFTRATAIAEGDPRVRLGLARAHALWAQALEFDASDLEARAEDDPSLRGEANRIRREAEQHADEARHHAEALVRQETQDPEAKLVLADALRLSGDPQGARRHLDEARRLFDDPPAELHRIAGLLRSAEADGDLAAAEVRAHRAVDAAPERIRARLLLARALLAKNDVSAARRQVDAILDQDSGHPRATSLRRAIERGVPPAAPTVEVLDGGVRDAGEAAATGDAGPAPDQPEESGPGADDEEQAEPSSAAAQKPAAGVPAGRDYDWYVSQGEDRLVRGDVGGAKRHFQAALRKRPNGSEALAGLGFVALDAGDAREAIRRFRPAASRGYADALIGLGDAYRRTGRREQALDAYKKYLEEHPNGKQASIARRHVRALEEDATGGQQGDEGGSPEPAPDEDTADSADAPATPEDSLPAPEGTDPDNPPPSSDPPAIGTE